MILEIRYIITNQHFLLSIDRLWYEREKYIITAVMKVEADIIDYIAVSSILGCAGILVKIYGHEFTNGVFGVNAENWWK